MSISIELDKPRQLKYDLAAVRDLEAAMDGKPLAGIIVDISRIGITALVAALWAGLKHEDKSLSINLVTKMLDRHLAGKKDGRERLRTIAKAIDQALDETGIFSTAEDDEGNVQPEQAAVS